MAKTLIEMEDELVEACRARSTLDIETLKKSCRLIRGSQFLREFARSDSTVADLSRTARELNRELDKLLGGERVLLPQEDGAPDGGTQSGSQGPNSPSSGRNSGPDPDAGNKFGAGMVAVGGVMLALGNPGGAIFVAAGGIAIAVAAFMQ